MAGAGPDFLLFGIPVERDLCEWVMGVATENRIRAGAAAAMGYSHRRDALSGGAVFLPELLC